MDGENVEWFVADEMPRARLRPQRDRRSTHSNRLRAKITYSPIARFFLAPSSPSPSSARSTRPCCASRSTPPTSAVRPWPPRPSSRPAPSCTGTSHRPPALPIPARPPPTGAHDDPDAHLLRQRRHHRRARAPAATPIWRADRGTSISLPATAPVPPSSTSIPEPVTRPGQLPAAYQRMSDDELHARIRTAKEKLGSDLVILGHFYQRDEVVQYADFVGDSFQLANAALTRPEAEHHRVLRRALHGRDRRHPGAPRSARHPAQPRGRLLDGRHGRRGLGRGRLGGADGDVRRRGRRRRPQLGHPGHLHELLGRAQGVLRPARRHRLHLVERRDRAGVGLRAGPAGAVLPRPAPRPQHGQGDGRTAGADADVEPAQAPRRQHRGRAAGRAR